MPILRDFERRLGDMVEGFFASTLRSGLQPVELAKRTMREMDAAKTVGVREVWAPNRFVFGLSLRDADRFEQAEQALITELKQVVRDAAAERGWGLVGPPEIEFVVDEGLGVGRFMCEASFVEGEDELPPAPRSDAEATLSLLQDGRVEKSYRLRKDVISIGRLPESDVQIADPGASRQHARILRREDGFVLVDLGSTNGTLVNDELAHERRLEDGDRITIGNAVLEFRSG
jgi:Protein of unknown function (DUF3662)/FHA domain